MKNRRKKVKKTIPGGLFHVFCFFWVGFFGANPATDGWSDNSDESLLNHFKH